jgi:hypothetical protein
MNNRVANDHATPANGNSGTNGNDASSAAASLMLATLNVNSIKGKKAQVLCMMESVGVDVLLLQET